MNRIGAILVVGVLLSAATGSMSLAEEESREERNKAVVRAYMQQIVNDNDWSAWPELIGESLRFNGQTMSQESMKGMATLFRSILPDLKMKVEAQIAEGDVVATRVTITGTHEGDYMGLKASGKKLSFSGLAYDRIRDGRVVEMWHEMNLWGTLLMASDD